MQLLIAIYAAACIFVAAVIRGYAGFGFSLLSITSLSVLLPPSQAIPSIFVLEVAASLRLLISVWRDICWQPLRWLAAGCLLGTPLGVYALAHVSPAPLTAFLALVVLVAAVLLARGYALHAMPNKPATFCTGVASGLLNGSVGIGGPPVILFFFSSPAGVVAGRASLIAYFLLTDIMAIAWQWFDGLMNRQVLVQAVLFAPAMLAGVWLGNRAFAAVDAVHFRRWVLRLLMLLAALTGGRALWQMR